MKLIDLLSKITGFSTPIFGIQWQPPHRERVIAERVLTFLEDKRVLYPQNINYNLVHMKSDYPIKSVLQIREYLTKEMQGIPRDCNLHKILNEMRKTCRLFLEKLEEQGIDKVEQEEQSLIQLKLKMPNLLTNLCFTYGMEISPDLTKMFPEEVQQLFPVEEKLLLEQPTIELTDKLRVVHKIEK